MKMIDNTLLTEEEVIAMLSPEDRRKFERDVRAYGMGYAYVDHFGKARYMTFDEGEMEKDWPPLMH